MGQPTEYNIETRQEASWTKGFVWQVDGVPMSFDGYRIVSQIKASPSRRLLVDLADHIEIEPNGETGRFVIKLGGDVTKTLPLVSDWDLYVVAVNDSTDADPLLAGKVFCSEAVSDV